MEPEYIHIVVEDVQNLQRVAVPPQQALRAQ